MCHLSSAIPFAPHNIHSAADDEVVPVRPVIQATLARGGKLDEVLEALLGEPGLELVERVMGLVSGSVPVEIVADAERPVGVVREVGDLVQDAIQHGYAAQQTEPGAGALESA